MCNQAALLSQCLKKVQGFMVTQLKVLHNDKGKSSSKMQEAVDELDYLDNAGLTRKYINQYGQPDFDPMVQLFRLL